MKAWRCLPPRISTPGSSKHSGKCGRPPWTSTMRRIPSATSMGRPKSPDRLRWSRSIRTTVRLPQSYSTIRKRSKSHQHRSAPSCPRLLHKNRRRCVGKMLTRSEMARKGHSVEQISAALKQHNLGMPVADIARKLGIIEATFYRWKEKYGALEPVSSPIR